MFRIVIDIDETKIHEWGFLYFKAVPPSEGRDHSVVLANDSYSLPGFKYGLPKPGTTVFNFSTQFNPDIKMSELPIPKIIDLDGKMIPEPPSFK